MDKIQEFYYHHSSHGSITLHKLLVDKDRREKIILGKYAVPDIAQGNIDFFVNTYHDLGSILLVNGEQNESYISSIQHVRRRETIAMTPANCFTY